MSKWFAALAAILMITSTGVAQAPAEGLGVDKCPEVHPDRCVHVSDPGPRRGRGLDFISSGCPGLEPGIDQG